MNDSKTNEPNPSDELEHAVDELKQLGKTWTKYGLNAGRAALETSAFTLRSTAKFLGHVSDFIDKHADAAKSATISATQDYHSYGNHSTGGRKCYPGSRLCQAATYVRYDQIDQE